MLESLFVKSSDLASIKDTEHDEAILVLPYIDHELAVRLEVVLRERARSPGLVILVDDDKRMGFIMAANLVYAWTRSPYFGYLAQDAFPGDHWLEQGLKTLKDSKSGLLAFNDGRFFGTVAVFGLAHRAWLETIYHNALFYPEYKTHFGDTELTAIAYMQDKLVFNPNCLLVEVDYRKHEQPLNPEDQELYNRRARTGFNGLVTPFDPEQADK